MVVVAGGIPEVHHGDVDVALFGRNKDRALPAQPGENLGVALDVVADRFEPVNDIVRQFRGEDAGVQSLELVLQGLVEEQARLAPPEADSIAL